MDYKAIIIRKVSGEDYAIDLLVDMLGEVGYEAFEETDEGLMAYCAVDIFSQTVLEEVIEEAKTFAEFKFAVQQVADRNWNKLWETTGYKPIDIDECHIHASNMPISDAKYDVIIDPDQSFGTGYHATTQMMLKLLMKSELKGLSLLDVGCGTAVLSIMALKRGAAEVDGVDIDERAAENAKYNVQLNGLKANIFTGTIDAVAGKKYNYVLANINRNTLIEIMPQLVDALNDTNGTLLLSGFYTSDSDAVVTAAERYGLRLVTQLTDDDEWTALKLSNNK